MNKYLERHAYVDRQIKIPPRPDLQLVVIIPAYAEQNLLTTLQSLCACDEPYGAAECIVVINAPEDANAQILKLNQKALSEVDSFHGRLPPWLSLHVIVENELPVKKAGVGLARKLGMDEAVRRFVDLKRDGLIINIDADCTCSPNYFTAIQSHFEANPKTWSGCLEFCHLFEDLSGQERAAIVAYELHLRYFIAAQKTIGLPFAYQTVGSCMVVRCSAYQKRGGMNTRKAGEDFYFVHKFVSIGRHSDIPQVKVYPSARASFRVPFGTGRAVSNYQQTGVQLTSAWQNFLDLQKLVLDIKLLFEEPLKAIEHWPISIRQYFDEIRGLDQIKRIRSDTSSFDTFHLRFYQWFDAFQLMKYVHYGREFYPDQPVLSQARILAEYLQAGVQISSLDAEGLLEWYRQSVVSS